MAFTKEEKNILRQYFSSTDSDIFALINLPEVIKGTLFSRYSRTAKDIRRLFLDEFFNSQELQGIFAKEESRQGKALDVKKAEDFYERVLIGYGDDSVAELGGAHVALENISVLATKSIEEHRMGLSPLEKSTRYVYYDKKVDGDYMYYKDATIMKSKHAKLYISTIQTLFETYSKIVREIQPFLMKLYPGNTEEKAYAFSIRAKACDIARGLLPLAVKTNMGIYGNGRAIEYVLLTLLHDPIQEVREMGLEVNNQLSTVIPSLIKRATSERGDKYRIYLDKTEKNLAKQLKTKNGKVKRAEAMKVTLTSFDPKAVEKVIAAIIYQSSNFTYKEAYQKASKMGKRQQELVLKTTSASRENRHQKPGRYFEEAYFGFEVVADWGVYKDLMRHRILTRHRQRFTNELGYILPKEVEIAGFGKIYKDAMEKAIQAYQTIQKDYPVEAQYLVTHGSYNRFYMLMNLREVIHLTELRSSPQGHPTYRKVAQEMAKAVVKQFPVLGKYVFPFVDYKDYGLERLEAFRKIENKAGKFGVKGFEE